MIQTFRARVHLYTLDGRRSAEAECLLAVEMAAFTRSRWSGTLTNPRPAAPPVGRYLLRLPNGRVSEIELGADQLTGCPFTGIGAVPLG